LKASIKDAAKQTHTHTHTQRALAAC